MEQREHIRAAVSESLPGVRTDRAAEGRVDLPGMQRQSFVCDRSILYEVREGTVT